MYGQPRPSIDPLALEKAGRTLLGAVLGGAAWADELEGLMPRLGCFGGGLARVTPPNIFTLPTLACVDTMDAIKGRRAPPLSALTRVDPAPEEGFVCDQMEPFAEARARDPFTAEFLRPRGFDHMASAFLDRTDRGDVNFLCFRGRGTAGFDVGDLRAFGAFLPFVRAAAMFTRGGLQLDADRRAAPFSGRGDPVLHLAFDGTVQERSIDVARSLAPDVTLSTGRLAVARAADQRRLDQALAAALVDGVPCLVTVTGEEAKSQRLLVVPSSGPARDVFRTTAALVVVLDVVRRPRVDEATLDLLARAGGLTRRERDVVRLAAGGLAPRKVAEELGVTYETTRLYLKAAYAKLDVHGQVELCTLAARLSSH